MINFVHSTSPNYVGVQEQIFSLIAEHLDPAAFHRTVTRPVPTAFNFSLFLATRADAVMSHGVADKNYLLKRDDRGRRMLNRFRHVFVPGDWLRRRLIAHPEIELGPDQIHVVGWPRLDLLRRVSSRKSEGTERLKVLWAPSHDSARRGEDRVSTSSYPELLPHLPLLEAEFDFRVSVHPRNRELKRPTLEDLVEADVVISDFGTMVYEAWALGKPVIFPTWIIGERVQEYLPGSAEAHIFERRIGSHAADLDELIDLARVSRECDETVRLFLANYLDPRFERASAARVAALLTELA